MASEGRTITESNAYDIARWCGGTLVTQHDALDHSKTIPGVNVPIGDEVERASLGDMVIRNHDGSYQINKKE
jgi:hypothetical protein